MYSINRVSSIDGCSLCINYYTITIHQEACVVCICYCMDSIMKLPFFLWFLESSRLCTSVCEQLKNLPCAYELLISFLFRVDSSICMKLEITLCWGIHTSLQLVYKLSCDLYVAVLQSDRKLMALLMMSTAQLRCQI